MFGGPFRNLTNIGGVCSLPVERSKSVSKAPGHRLTGWAAINISLFKVSWPLTYRSLPSLPPEGLCFPTGPRSGFHLLPTKACMHFASSLSLVRKNDTSPAGLSNISSLQKEHHVCEIPVCTGCECVQNCSGKRTGKVKEMKTHRFPVCGISVSVLELIHNWNPVDVSTGRGLPVDHDIII